MSPLNKSELVHAESVNVVPNFIFRQRTLLSPSNPNSRDYLMSLRWAGGRQV